MQLTKFFKMNRAELLNFLVGVLLLIALTSCSNFLKAGQIKEELEKIIDYNNAKSYTILVTADKDSGQIKKPVTGDVSKKVTDVFEIKFEPDPGYSFARWEASSPDLPPGENINDYIEFEDAQNPETKVTFKKELSSITINAVCPHLPFVNFELKGGNGNISPVTGSYTCIQTYTYRLAFEPESYYEFIRWELYDLKANHEVQNGKYITIENPLSKDTTYSFVSAPDDPEIKLVIRPKVVERPQVISNSPQTSGVRKDTSIQVLFDHDMDKASIYYTEDEIDQMCKDGLADEPCFEETVLNSKGENQVVYKGYKKDGKLYFKNVCITNNRNGVILNEWFEPPVFEDKRSLVIKIKRVEDPDDPGTYNLLVQNYTQILVSIEKGMSYSYEDKAVAMTGNKKWMYQVGSETDSTAPGVTLNGTLQPITELTGALDFSTVKDIPVFKGNNLQLNMDLNLTVDDAGSGPRNWFKICLTKVYGDDYKQLPSATTVYETTVDYNKDILATSASFEGSVPLDIPKFEEGIYELSCVFSDLSGNEVKKIFKYISKCSFVPVQGTTVSGAVADSSVFIEGRTVTIGNLWVCDHEVTQKEYTTYCKYGSSIPGETYGVGDNYPAYYLSWYDAVVYCNLRSMAENLTPVYKIGEETDPTKWEGIAGNATEKYCGPSKGTSKWDYKGTYDPDGGIVADFAANGYRLPTEVEWEYIAREANNSAYTYSGSNEIDDVTWYKDNSDGKIHEVKGKTANALGIYDMSGNVWEWCFDWAGKINSETPSTGVQTGAGRFRRGGNAREKEENCTVFHRAATAPEIRAFYGLRVVRNAD